MALIYLVRHGKAAASFTDDIDPGLDSLGHSQAQAACSLLEKKRPLLLASSPLRRAQETAAPLSALTSQTVRIEQRVAEIPSPGVSLEDRGGWLHEVMSGKWSQQSEFLQQWRTELGNALLQVDADTAIFSHYVAINAAVGVAQGIDDVHIFRPDNASITVFETDGKNLTLVTRGDEAVTKVN